MATFNLPMRVKYFWYLVWNLTYGAVDVVGGVFDVLYLIDHLHEQQDAGGGRHQVNKPQLDLGAKQQAYAHHQHEYKVNGTHLKIKINYKKNY